MNGAIYLIIGGITIGIITIIKPKFFVKHHEFASRFLGDKGTIIVHLIVSVVMIIIGMYFIIKKMYA